MSKNKVPPQRCYRCQTAFPKTIKGFWRDRILGQSLFSKIKESLDWGGEAMTKKKIIREAITQLKQNQDNIGRIEDLVTQIAISQIQEVLLKLLNDA